MQVKSGYSLILQRNVFEQYTCRSLAHVDTMQVWVPLLAGRRPVSEPLSASVRSMSKYLDIRLAGGRRWTRGADSVSGTRG